MNNNMSLKYVGKGVDDGSIEVDSLICGLRGLVKLSTVVLNAYEPSRKKDISLRIKSFNKGSFETILDFIEKHPALMSSASLIVATVIAALAHYFTSNKQIKKLDNKEAERVLAAILSNDSSMRKIKEGFHNMALPLNEDGINAVKFGLTESPEQIMSQENKDCFLDKDLYREEIHKSIALVGSLRALDKKTLNGKFVTDDDKTYSISLVMDSPEDYFLYFDRENITISGIATHEKESNEIIKIEIEKIRPTEQQ